MSTPDEPLELRFEMRGYEANRHGEVPLSTFARYCEMMRWRVAYERPVQGGSERGVVRAQTHRVLRPVRFPATLVARAFICRAGRTSFDFEHALDLADGTPVARARTTIVCLNADGRPTDVGDGLRDVVRPAGPETPAHPPLLALDDTLVEWHVDVRPSDEDMFGHVNQARYIDFLDDARVAAELPRIHTVSASYEAETHAGDSVRVRVGAGTDGWHPYEMRRGDERVLNRGMFRV